MLYGKIGLNIDFRTIENAIEKIERGVTNRVDGGRILIYKVPSDNPNQYLIRIDIEETMDEE